MDIPSYLTQYPSAVKSLKNSWDKTSSTYYEQNSIEGTLQDDRTVCIILTQQKNLYLHDLCRIIGAI